MAEGSHDQPQRAVATTKAGMIRRRVIPLVALAAIAIAPWFVPWHQVFGSAAPAADPSEIIQRAHEGQPSADPTNDQPPGDEAVKGVTKAVNANAQGRDLPVSKKELASIQTTPGPYQKLGRLQIPRVGLDVSFGEGVSEKVLAKGPGHWPGTPMPGRAGNSVISGHRNTNTQPFKYLNVLKPGDTVIVTYGSAKPVTYHVTKTTIVPQAKYKDFVLAQPDDAKTRELTMFACHPEGNPIYRIVVQATASS